jgi:hypothetical protein
MNNHLPWFFDDNSNRVDSNTLFTLCNDYSYKYNQFPGQFG